MEGLVWRDTDLAEVVTESAFRLRQAMRYSDGACEVKRLVDAKLLEMLWCPCGSAGGPRWLSKDVVRSELRSLSLPQSIWNEGCRCNFDPGQSSRCEAGSLLARVLLGSMDWLFECESKSAKGQSIDDPLLWVVAKLHDQLGGVNSFRTLSGMERVADEYRAFQMLYRLPEAGYEWFTGRMVDFSALLLDAEERTEVDYCLVCQAVEPPEDLANHIKVYRVDSIVDILRRERRIDELQKRLALFNSERISDQLSRSILTEDTRRYTAEERLRRRQQAGQDVNSWIDSTAVTQALRTHREVEDAVNDSKAAFETCCFEEDGEVIGALRAELRTLLERVKATTSEQLAAKIHSGEVSIWKLANYFIWLSALHPDLCSYTVRYGANYRLMPTDSPGAGPKQDRIQNSCFVIASRGLPSSRLLAGARVSLTHCLGPLEDYYALKKAKHAGQRNEYIRWTKVMGHELTKVYSPLAEVLTPSVFRGLPVVDQSTVLDFAREAFAVGDMWAVTGKNEQTVQVHELTDASTLKTALERCCEHAWKFNLIKQRASALRYFLESDSGAAAELRREFESGASRFAVTVDDKNATRWLASASRTWSGESNLAADWFGVVILAVVGNAFQNADSRYVVRVHVSFSPQPQAVMIVKVQNVHNNDERRRHFIREHPEGLRAPKSGTFLVLDQCGEALYRAIGMQQAYRLAEYCSVEIGPTEASVTLRFPSGGSGQ